MKNKGLASYLLLLSTSAVGLQDSFHFLSIYLDPIRREQFSSFYHEVLRFIPARKMDHLIHQEVAGNRWIVLAIEAQESESESLCHSLIGCKELFSFNSVIDSNIKLSMVQVDFRVFHDVFKRVNEIHGCSIKHIFNY